jgi:hypothetical protein
MIFVFASKADNIADEYNLVIPVPSNNKITEAFLLNSNFSNPK